MEHFANSKINKAKMFGIHVVILLGGTLWKGRKCWFHLYLLFYQLFTTQTQVLMSIYGRAFENIAGRGENAFSPFPTMFTAISKTEIIILAN